MTPTRTLFALLAIHLVALTAAAQTDTSEFGRASGGEITAITKGPRQLSGSLTLSRSTGARSGQGYEGSIGGELLNDRLWFFAAASALPRVQFSTPELSGLDAKATAQPVDWTTVTAAFTQLQQPVFATPTMANDASLSSRFLSLRSTSILSERMTLDFRFSHTTGTRPVYGFPADPQ